MFRPTIIALCALFLGTASADDGVQSGLEMTLNDGDQYLDFDWPILKIGTGQYEDGPTGVTVFHFDKKVSVAIDVKGGGPGTVNAPYMEMGYDLAELDTVVFAGGSWYGLEAVTAVASALKDDGLRDGDAFAITPSIAMSVGAIIFDFGSRRLNEIYPDKRLAQAAFRSAQPGRFPLGPYGGGRSAVTGGFFGCNAKSGQGGAFRQIGDVKIAAFTVVNALGVVVDRDGKVVSCYGKEDWPDELYVKDLFQSFPQRRDGAWSDGQDAAEKKNTTISLVVTNQKLSPQDLKRLAVQVHASMARGIQPFGTVFDGDVLYAVSTGELEEQVFYPIDLGTIASEVMWDAVLSAAPEQPNFADIADGPVDDAAALESFAGDYRFSDEVAIRVEVKNGKLRARGTGEKRAFAVVTDKWTELEPVSPGRYAIRGRYPFVAVFSDDAVTLNPGRWEQKGVKVFDID